MIRSSTFVLAMIGIMAPVGQSNAQPIDWGDDVEPPSFTVAGGPWAFLDPVPLVGEKRILIIFHNYNPALQIGDPDPLPQFVQGVTMSGQVFTVYGREDVYGLVFDDRYPAPFGHETVNDWFREVSNDRFRISGDVVAYCTLDIDMYPRPSALADSDGDGIDDYREWQDAVERGNIQCAQERGHNVDILHVPASEDNPNGLEVVGSYDVVVFVDTWSQPPPAFARPFVFAQLNGGIDIYPLIHELGHDFRFYHANSLLKKGLTAMIS